MLLDTSGLLAALFPDQQHHAACARALLDAQPPLLLSPFVLAELDYLVATRVGVRAEIALLDDVASGAYELVPFDRAMLARAAAIVRRYADAYIGLADASIVVLAERAGVDRVLTLDERHFRALRDERGRRFRIVPDTTL